MFTTYSSLQILLLIAVAMILTAIAVMDIRTRRIPDMLNVALLLCGVAAIYVFPEVHPGARFIGLFAVSLPLLLFTFVVKDSFGMGDVKLMAAAGFLLGWRYAISAFLLGILLGGIYGAVLLISRRRSAREHFAFGPCLAVGIITALAAGETMTHYFPLP
ncbi:MAG: A24 family peptidase [Clostridiales Family XIII bacterium]|jgi:leader peptidase (prepilin peptidase)/N-methyltransferase|nr:A24 family peptidase [Clostridiales Family XIII bacterium]